MRDLPYKKPGVDVEHGFRPTYWFRRGGKKQANHEITREAVEAALADPGSLDMDLVNAQQAQRILDRLVGYQVSPVLWDAIDGPTGLSAGRVQTVALRLVVEHDREIEAFDPEEYWLLEVELSKVTDEDLRFRARLVEIEGEKANLETEDEVQDFATLQNFCSCFARGSSYESSSSKSRPSTSLYTEYVVP